MTPVKLLSKLIQPNRQRASCVVRRAVIEHHWVLPSAWQIGPVDKCQLSQLASRMPNGSGNTVHGPLGVGPPAMPICDASLAAYS